MGVTESVQAPGPELHTRARLLKELGGDKNSFINAALSNDVQTYVLKPFVLPRTVLCFDNHEINVCDADNATFVQKLQHTLMSWDIVVPLRTSAIVYSGQGVTKVSAWHPPTPLDATYSLGTLDLASAVAGDTASFVCGGKIKPSDVSFKPSRNIYTITQEHGVRCANENAPFLIHQAHLMSVGSLLIVCCEQRLDWIKNGRTPVDTFCTYDVRADQFGQLPAPTPMNILDMGCTSWDTQMFVLQNQLCGRSDVWVGDVRSPDWTQQGVLNANAVRVARCHDDHVVWLATHDAICDYDLRAGRCIRELSLPYVSDPHPLHGSDGKIHCWALVYCDSPSSL